MIILEFLFRLISKDNEKIMNRQGRYFLSKKYVNFEKDIKKVASAAYKGDILECPLKVTIAAYFRTKVRPDCFNLPKSLCDALQGIVYKNDRQIRIGRVVVISEKWERDLFKVYIEEVHDAEFIKEDIIG